MQVNALEVCPYEKWCGGCQYQKLPYAEQLEKKQEYVNKLLKKYAKPEKIIGMNFPYYYRNKVHAVFGGSVRGKIVAGTYEPDSHRIVNIETCQIQDKKSNAIINTIKGLLPSFRMEPYNEDTGKGLLRHVLIRKGFSSGEIMVILVTASPIFPSKKNFVNALRKEHPEITTVVQNINDKSTSMILGDREEVLYGKGFIRDTLLSCTFRISPKSFYQVNPTQTKHLYRTALEMAQLTGTEKVVDAYCGTGTIGIIAAKQMAEDAAKAKTGQTKAPAEGKAGSVIGVELNADAVRDARKNAKENGLKNISFVCDDASEWMMKQAAAGEHIDVLLMDPPRSGSTPEFIHAAETLAPERIVYISCNPTTQADDLKLLTKKYKVERIVPVDMFPFTSHVETVCLLSKLSGAKNTIDVKVDMDELDVTSAETKATYEEIKAYVLEQTGLQVSNLYIAQVKRECGIIERENYNNPKSEESRQPQCPEEKRKAIMEALKHFGMV